MSVTRYILKLYIKALVHLNAAQPHTQRCTYIQLYAIECANSLTRTQCIRVKPETLSFSPNCKHELRPNIHSQIALLYIRLLCILTGKLYFMRISLFHLALIWGAFMQPTFPRFKENPFHSHVLELDCRSSCLEIYARKPPSKSYKQRSYLKVKGYERGLQVCWGLDQTNSILIFSDGFLPLPTCPGHTSKSFFPHVTPEVKGLSVFFPILVRKNIKPEVMVWRLISPEALAAVHMRNKSSQGCHVYFNKIKLYMVCTVLVTYLFHKNT